MGPVALGTLAVYRLGLSRSDGCLHGGLVACHWAGGWGDPKEEATSIDKQDLFAVHQSQFRY